MEFPPMRNEKILNVIRGCKIECTPVWMMGQVEWYLPEFRELRKKHNFFDICHNPQLACEATLLPVQRFNVDAAIIFSHILVLPQALGMDVIANPVPIFPEPLSPERVCKLRSEGAIARLNYVGEAITLTRQRLNGEAVLFGFAGAPWTLMSYMIEGAESKKYTNAKRWLFKHKKESHELIRILVNVISDYCIMQGKAGAQVIQIFDTNARFLDEELYSEFCMPGLIFIREKVASILRACGLDVPMVIFARGLNCCYKALTEAGYEVISLDWRTDPLNPKSTFLPKGVCYQGNLDPCILYTTPSVVRQMVIEMLDRFKDLRLIANLGGSIYPDTPLENIHAFVNAVKSYDKTKVNVVNTEEPVEGGASVGSKQEEIET